MRGGYKTTLFLGSLVILALSCVYAAVGFTPSAHAESYEVTATVPAPLPSSPPVITSPLDQTRFTTNTITVEGTCSPDTAYIALERSGLIAGTAPCISGQFTLQITLFPSANSLIAGSFSSTDGEGPSSAPVTVYLDTLPEPPTPLQPSTPSTPPAPPLLPPALLTPTSSSPGEDEAGVLYLTYNPRYIIKKPGETWSWFFTVHGGTAPYAFTVDWGDGTSTHYAPDASNQVIARHIYQKEGTYVAFAEVTDAHGVTAGLQFFATARNDASPASYSPPYFSWIVAILLTSLLALFALLDIELLIASVVQLIRRKGAK